MKTFQKISDLDFVRKFAQGMMERTSETADALMTGRESSGNDSKNQQLMCWNRGYAQACRDILNSTPGGF